MAGVSPGLVTPMSGGARNSISATASQSSSTTGWLRPGIFADPTFTRSAAGHHWDPGTGTWP